MKITTNRQTILKAIHNINIARDKSDSKYIKISTNNNEVSFYSCLANNFSIISKFIVKEELQNDYFFIDGDFFQQIITSLSSDVISIERTGMQIEIKNDKTIFRLPILGDNLINFNEIHCNEFTSKIEINGDEFARMINQIEFATSKDETRVNLQNIHIKISDNKMLMVATDGHVLAVSNISVESKDIGAIISKDLLIGIKKVIGNNKVLIHFSDNRVKIEFDNTCILSALIDYDVVPFERVIPKANDIVVNIDKQNTMKALERILIVASDRHRSVKFAFSKNKLLLEHINESKKELVSIEELDCDCDNSFEIGFNAKYMLNILAKIIGDKVSIKFSNETSPCLICDDIGSVFVLMPIRL